MRSELSPDELWWILDRLPTAVVVVDRDFKVRYRNVAAQRLAHPKRVRVGEELPDLGVEPTLRDLAHNIFQRGMIVEHEVRTEGDRAYLIDGIAHQKSGVAVLRIDDVTARARRARAEHDFVVNAAHEFLSPLTAIAGAAYVLQASADEEPGVRDRFVGHISAAADQLVSIARAVLVLARAEAGAEPPRLELVPLRPLLDELAADASDSVTIGSCSTTAAVLADRDLLRQAMRNLIENARRHSTETIEVRVSEIGGRTIAIDITDRGSGILPEHLERVTQRFFSAGGRDSGGHGIGLSLAARALDVMGATLELESNRKGTRVRVKIPSARLVAA